MKVAKCNIFQGEKKFHEIANQYERTTLNIIFKIEIEKSFDKLASKLNYFVIGSEKRVWEWIRYAKQGIWM